MCYQFCHNFPKPIHKVKNNHKVHAVVTREKKKKSEKCLPIIQK